MSGMIVTVEYEVIPHPWGEKFKEYRRYSCYQFHHHIHGAKQLGCFIKDTPKNFNEAARSFTLASGYKDGVWQNHYNFVRRN